MRKPFFCFTMLVMLVMSGCAGEPPRPLPEPLQDARSLHESGRQAFDGGRYELALHNFEQAERHFKSLDDAHGVAAAAISQAEIHLVFARDEQAADAMQRARIALDGLQDESLRQRLVLLDARAVSDSDPAQARRLLATLDEADASSVTPAQLLACELSIETGATDCLDDLVPADAMSQARIARLKARAASDPAIARAQLEEALAVYRAQAYRPGIASVHEALGEIFIATGMSERALEHLERALYLRLWIQDRVRAAETLEMLARHAKEPGQRNRYRQWRAIMLDESEQPAWDRLLEELFTRS